MFSPLSQYLASAQADGVGGVLAGVDGVHAACAALCDTNNVMGDAPDELLYRLNRAKAAGHLAGRVRRLARELTATARVHQSRLRAAMGSFSAASEPKAGAALSAAAEPGSGTAGGREEEVPMEHTLMALGIMSDYVDDTWTEAVADELA